MSKYKLRYGRFMELKKAQNRTQSGLGKQIRLPRQRVNRVVNGHDTCSKGLALRWAAAMYVPMKELFVEVKEVEVE